MKPSRFASAFISFCFYLHVGAVCLGYESQASAQTYANWVPYYYNGYWMGQPVSYGFFSASSWGWNYWGSPYWSGYSYYAYYNHQPYYATFAAISYGPKTKAAGVAWGKYNRDFAANAANEFCGQSDCRAVVWVQGGCAGVTTSAATGRVTWGTGSTQQDAYYNALQACQVRDDKGELATDCKELAWACSY